MAEGRPDLAQPNSNWARWLPGSVRARIEGRGRVQSVVANIGWQSADHVVRTGIGLLLGVWMARYLGPAQFGALSYALAFVALFSPLAAVGLDDIAVRNLVRDPASRDEILGTSFLLKLAGGLLSFAAAASTVSLLRPGDGLTRGLVAVIAAGGAFQAFNAIEFWFHAQVQAKYPVLAKNVAFLACALLRAALILGRAPLVAFAWVALAEMAAGSAALVAAYRWRGHRLRDWSATLRTARSLLRDAWPLAISCLVILVYLRIDQVMLGDMVGSEAVGVYSVAVRLAEVWLFFSSALYRSVLPGLIEAKATDEAVFYRQLQTYYNFVALAGYAVAVPTTFLAKPLVHMIFGASYVDAAPMLVVLIWGNIFIFLDSARSAFFNAMNWYKLYLATLALGALLNVGLNLFLIPRYGGLGAAAASCASYWFAAHGSCFLYRPLRKTGVMLTRALVWPKIW